MKIAFVSSYFNHHQKMLSEELFRLTCGQYTFISTVQIRKERKELGYKSDGDPDYVIKSYLSPQDMQRAKQCIADADVVLTGSAPEWMIEPRIRAGKPVFRYSERPLKEGLEPLKYLPRLIRWRRRNPSRAPVYMLCASAYSAADYGKFGLFKGRTYKWGYFPETKRYASLSGLMAGKNRTEILWCGRFLDWKHPDDALKAARRLKEDGYGFTLNFIGTGELTESLTRAVADYGLSDCVHLLGSMPPEQVREHMERAGIYLFTSDRQEGWGAVLNESMNSGCAVVASHLAGATPYLVEDGENGLIYRSEDASMLYEKIRFLLDRPDEQERLGTAAYATVTEEWNAVVAAERFLQLAQCVADGGTPHKLFVGGPCSTAKRIKDNWF